jgi:hypothetical protein
MIADLDVQRTHIAVLQQFAAPNRLHGAARRLLGSGARQDNAAGTLGFFLNALDNYPIMQGSKVHRLHLLKLKVR